MRSGKHDKNKDKGDGGGRGSKTRGREIWIRGGGGARRGKMKKHAILKEQNNKEADSVHDSHPPIHAVVLVLYDNTQHASLRRTLATHVTQRCCLCPRLATA